MKPELMYQPNHRLSVDEKREELIDQITKLRKVRAFDRAGPDELILEYRDVVFALNIVHDDGTLGATDDDPLSKLDVPRPRLVTRSMRSWKDQPMELEQTEIVARFRVERFPTIEVRRRPASVVDAERWYVTIGSLFGSQTLRCLSAAVAFRVIDQALRAINSNNENIPPPEGAKLVNDDGEAVDKDGIPLSTIEAVNEQTEAYERENENLSYHEDQDD